LNRLPAEVVIGRGDDDVDDGNVVAVVVPSTRGSTSMEGGRGGGGFDDFRIKKEGDGGGGGPAADSYNQIATTKIGNSPRKIQFLGDHVPDDEDVGGCGSNGKSRLMPCHCIT
jgi:hypothetical protein